MKISLFLYIYRVITIKTPYFDLPIYQAKKRNNTHTKKNQEHRLMALCHSKKENNDKK